MRLRRQASEDDGWTPSYNGPQAALEPDLRVLPADTRLGDLLMATGSLSPEDLSRALRDQAATGRRLGDLLLAEGAIDERMLTYALARQLRIPLADLRHESPDPRGDRARCARRGARPRAPPDSAARRSAPRGRGPRPARSSPRRATSSRSPSGSCASTSRRVPRSAPRSTSPIPRSPSSASTSRRSRRARPLASSPSRRSLDSDDDAPVVQVVNKIVTQALRDRASDVHIEPAEDRVRVRFRIDGALKRGPRRSPSNMGQAARQPHQDHGRHEHRRAAPSARRSVRDERSTVASSTSACRRPSTIWGEKTVLRLLDRTRSLYRLGELGMPARRRTSSTRALVRSPYGMVIVGGPTGSGKTTTLYATLVGDQPTRHQRDDDRRPGRVHLPDGQPDPDQRAGRHDVRHRSQVDPAPGPRRDPRRRGPRRRDRTHRRAVGAHRSPRVLVGPRHRRGRRRSTGCSTWASSRSSSPPSIVGVVAQRLVRRICTLVRGAVRAAAAGARRSTRSSAARRSTRGCAARAATSAPSTGYFDRVGVYEVLAITDEIRPRRRRRHHRRRPQARARTGPADASRRSHAPGPPRRHHHRRSRPHRVRRGGIAVTSTLTPPPAAQPPPSQQPQAPARGDRKSRGTRRSSTSGARSSPKRS